MILMMTVVAVCIASCRRVYSSGCVHHNPFSENMIINHMISTSRNDLLSGGIPPKERDVYRSDYWVVPKDTVIPKDSIYERFETYAGGSPTLLKFSSPDMDKDVYQLKVSAYCPFPITARGLPLSMSIAERLPPMYAREIVCASDTVIYYVTPGEMDKVGFEEVRENVFRMRFPPNCSPIEKFWEIKLYFKDSASYEPRKISRELLGLPCDKPWAIVTLGFLQMADSTYAYSEDELRERVRAL